MLRSLLVLLVRIVVFGSLFWTSFCAIVFGLSWIAGQGSNSNYGDDAGFGILCISVPIAAICTLLFFLADEWSARYRAAQGWLTTKQNSRNINGDE